MLREDSPECEEEEEEEEEAAQSREVGMEEELEREVERRKRTPSGRRTPVCGRHRYWGEKWENAIRFYKTVKTMAEVKYSIKEHTFRQEALLQGLLAIISYWQPRK